MVQLREQKDQENDANDLFDVITGKNYKYASVVIFVIIMMYMPWESLQGHLFVDRQVYTNYFLYEVNILEYRVFHNVLDYIKHEALWHYSVSTLIHDYSIPLEYVFTFITVLSLSVFSVFLVNRVDLPYLIMLFSPLLVTFSFSQLRMALAYSLIVLAYMARKKPLVVSLLVLPALFIHTSIIIFVCIYIAIKTIEYFESNKIFTTSMVFVSCFIVGTLISIAIGPLRDVILGAVGDRRASYGEASSSILYTIYWVGVLILTSVQSADFYKKDINKYTIIILSLVTVNLFTGGYTLRFLAIGLPFILYSILDMDKEKKNIAVFIYVLYFVFQWVYWLEISLVN